MSSQNKTQPTTKSVEDFISAISEEQKRKDSEVLLQMMGEVTNEPPTMWGESIIGFGTYHYKYKSGREGDWFLTGFSPRKNALTLYLLCDLSNDSLSFEGLGKYKLGKGCLYIKKLSDVSIPVLKKLIVDAVDFTKKYGYA